MSYAKSTIYFNSTSNSTASTISEQASNGGLQIAKSEYAGCDVLIALNTFTVSSGAPSINFAVQEKFSGSGFVTTAKTGSITASGSYWLSHLPANSAQITNSWGNFFALGEGIDKQIVTQVDGAGSITALGADIYFVFNSKNFT